MSDAIIVALITGGLSLIGVLISNSRAAQNMDAKLEKKQAITDTKLDELTREVREHNNFAKRVPVLEEQIKVATHRIEDLTETAVKAPACIVHREGSGLVTLRGLTNQCKARFKVSFGGNIAIPTGGTVGPISVALAVGGESLTSATAIVTPAAVENYFNVFVAAFIEVPRGCCVTVALKNTSTQAVSIANSNLIVERVA